MEIARNDNTTPLLIAVKNKHIDSVHRLMRHATLAYVINATIANVAKANDDGDAPLLYAARTGNVLIVRALLVPPFSLTNR